MFALEIDFGYKRTTFNSDKYYYQIEYFVIPTILKYYFSRHFLDPEIFEISFGIGFEYRFNVKDEGFGLSTSANSDNVGITLGLGTKNKIYKGLSLTLDFRFYYSLTPVFTTELEEKGYLGELDLLVGLSYDL